MAIDDQEIKAGDWVITNVELHPNIKRGTKLLVSRVYGENGMTYIDVEKPCRTSTWAGYVNKTTPPAEEPQS